MKFHDGVSKNPQISNSMKIRPVGSELFHADGRTDMTKPIVAFRNFVNAPQSHVKVWNLNFVFNFIYTISKE
jgi:hypothetical protein